ncbi:MAG: nicotinate (nicotinamide) nucleotide adenylyltransferase [Bdellovibrio sp.]|nr:nicotinate (nicotinamide) nucleotide adenylyltransferase [Bdellovibrio sp.]
MVVWHETIALFGGSFDPPHLGHLEAVKGLFTKPGIKKVILVPSANPPFKKNLTPINHRLKMIELSFLSAVNKNLFSKIEIDLCEVKRAELTKKPSYTYDTLLELKQVYSPEKNNLAFVIGTDQLEDMQSWHRFPEILQLSHWIILLRKPDGESKARKILQTWETQGLVQNKNNNIENDLWSLMCKQTYLKLVTTHAPLISSTEIRKHIAKSGTLPANTLHDDVVTYIKAHKLYGTS